MDSKSPFSSVNPNAGSISNSNESQPLSVNLATSPIPGASSGAEISVVQPRLGVPQLSISSSPLSSATPLSRSTNESLTGLKGVSEPNAPSGTGGDQQLQTAKLHAKPQESENLSRNADAVASPPGAMISSHAELSSMTSNSLSTPQSVSETAASITAATTAMAGVLTKPNAASLRKIAPAPHPAAEVAGKNAPALVPQPSETPKRLRKTAQKRNKKRKAGPFDDDEDGIIKAGNSDSESDECTSLTTQTKSGRQIHRPTVFAPQQNSASTSATGPTVSPAGAADGQSPPRKKRRVRKGKEVNITCERCERGYSPSSNPIVFCDDCNGAWHQFCHDPPIGIDVVKVKESEWFCSECRPVKVSASTEAIANSTEGGMAVTTTAYDNSFLEAHNLVGGSDFTYAEKLGYLSRLSHAALVHLLVQISDSDPDLPLFPSNLKDLHPSTFIPSSTSKPSNQTINPLSQEDPTQTTPSSSAPSHTTSQPTTDPENQPAPCNSAPVAAPAPSYDSDDEYIPEHRLYPRPGNGFRLPPDSVDLDMLLEDASCPTFSHALHGPAKMRSDVVGLEVNSEYGIVSNILSRGGIPPTTKIQGRVRQN
ncbi:hypothetical protein PRK78_000447 [Emydomyces testavorans]|uniref:PHD-type domain-containing protein n=1 Tax=Emydomyces testavorans TaxID=2070801 RepID=A0AAF0DB67_9EURO|nr:hypothetical protein PRK78_000447 [Emydomyces testavorans]